MLEYPKWIDAPAGNPGHPQNPGKVLVENEDQEREVKAGGEPPRDLNPAADPKDAAPADDKPVADMSREELISTLVRESITDDVSDDQLRESIQHLRERHSPSPLTDAAGEDVPPPVDQEANKGKDDSEEGRKLPDAKPEPATDARPDEAKAKEPDDKPAGNVTKAAATPPDAPKGTKATDKAK